jgi:hypothetical protein
MTVCDAWTRGPEAQRPVDAEDPGAITTPGHPKKKNRNS